MAGLAVTPWRPTGGPGPTWCPGTSQNPAKALPGEESSSTLAPWGLLKSLWGLKVCRSAPSQGLQPPKQERPLPACPREGPSLLPKEPETQGQPCPPNASFQAFYPAPTV